MRNTMLLLFALVFLILQGCQAMGSKGLAGGEISKVSIAESNGFGEVNTDFFAVWDDEETLVVFENVISNAEKEPGVVNMIEPDFDLEITYADGSTQGYHLWANKEGQKSTLMNVEDTNTIYTVPEVVTNQLIDVIENK
ncbi:hypothetical protein [Lentibacillus sediminis]|uniref:hypothetical protein n=1 Tax=Lentibacillus sediminis TaxID=1940529 RepID=UPI00117A219B|nr:hypothetical protein [Lentibacillus sediminis]